MNKVLTISDIKAKYNSEWILVEDPEIDESMNIKKGKVIAHSKDRDVVYRKAVNLRPKRFATLYTGTIPKDTAIIL